tara:strand:+ start:48910 stop:49278 length:369 start_codon:yes stop_codon:yes gene_type:complete
MNLVYFVLIAYGLTQILVYSDMPLLKKIRPSKTALRGYGKVFHCPMCLGFHVGYLLMLISPYTELFSFDISLVNFFLLGWLSSGTSYTLNMLFGDYGINVQSKIKGFENEFILDDEMDDTTS